MLINSYSQMVQILTHLVFDFSFTYNLHECWQRFIANSFSMFDYGASEDAKGIR